MTEDGSELKWFKSSFSSSSDINDCVEIATTPGTVHIRDSKAPKGPRLSVSTDSWAGLVRFVNASLGDA
ncbi:DUF397 domain-containing protein [Streptomyces luteolus]|uniref:DUF397 domain-containing protein n=1 Tax=Streptomyces luteolus TaxID=3043615 RepID=A0ABT6T2F7_9ACTN|nr:DUF397 domain-containing protein [Streptomyces sp. B-S-A12]MDI3421254.1 DUF397 domain-containing protein [Streptomyces sp. B-S-A12]